MIIKELEKDRLVLDWFTTIDAQPYTRRNYLRGMSLYTELVGKAPKELVEEAESDIKTGRLMRERNIRRYLIDFKEWLEKQKNPEGKLIAPKTKHNHLTAVISFYRSFDIDLPKLNEKQVKPREENGRRIEKNELQKILSIANIRNKAIILTALSSGLSQSDLLELTVGQVKRGYDSETEVTTLHIRRKKTKYDFITFLSPEASRAIQDYLKYRDREPSDKSNKALMEAYAKRKIKSDKDYLFVKEDIPRRYLKTLDESDRRLNSAGLMDAFRELADRAGLSTEKGEWQYIRAHNLRKYFNTTLLNNGADIFFVDYLMGHVVDQTHAAYFKADPEKLRKRYLEFVPYLSMEEVEVRTIESREYTLLKSENETLKTRLDMMDEVLAEMRAELKSSTLRALKEEKISNERYRDE